MAPGGGQHACGHRKASTGPPRVLHHSLGLAMLAGSRKVKDDGLRAKRRQGFLGLSPERAVGKVRLEGCPRHWSGMSPGSPLRAAPASSAFPVLKVESSSKCLSKWQSSRVWAAVGEGKPSKISSVACSALCLIVGRGDSVELGQLELARTCSVSRKDQHQHLQWKVGVLSWAKALRSPPPSPEQPEVSAPWGKLQLLLSNQQSVFGSLGSYQSHQNN